MKIEDLHEIICDALRRMGGVDGGKVVEKGLNADVVHRGHCVITEVKTFFEDRALTRAHKKYAHKVISRYRSSVGLDPINYNVGAENLPTNVQRLITKNYQKRFEKNLNFANKQIRNTRKYVGDGYSGLVILGMPNNYFANEGSVFGVLSGGNLNCREIDCVLMLAVDQHDPPTQPARVVLSERKQDAIPRAFLREFDAEWNSALTDFYGHEMQRVIAPEGAFFRDFGLQEMPTNGSEEPADPES